MSTLYVIEPGSRLEKEHQRLLVTLNDEVILRVPLGRVTRVVLVGRVGAARTPRSRRQSTTTSTARK